MSQYRDDRSAAQHRIEALEARLGEQQAELDARRDAIEERDAEIARLRGLGLAGAQALGRSRRTAMALASRFVFAAFGFTVAAGITIVRGAPHPARPPAVAEAPQAVAVVAPGGVLASAMQVVEDHLTDALSQGRASEEELRVLEAICALQNHTTCRDRAARALLRDRAPADPRDPRYL